MGKTRASEPIPEYDAPWEVWRAFLQRRIEANRAWLREQEEREERRRRRLQRLTLGLLGRD